MNLDKTITAVLALPHSVCSSEDKSLRTLLEESGYFDCHEKVSEERIRRSIARDPNLIREWMEFSENKRSNEGWYLRMSRNGGFIVVTCRQNLRLLIRQNTQAHWTPSHPSSSGKLRRSEMDKRLAPCSQQGRESKVLTMTRVLLTLVDPWDFVSSVGAGPYRGTIRKVGSDKRSRPAILLELDFPLEISRGSYRYFVATARHDRSDLGNLQAGTTVGVNVLHLPENRLNDPDLFEMAWWRGGPGVLIADLHVE